MMENDKKKHCFELQTEFHTKQINRFDESIFGFFFFGELGGENIKTVPQFQRNTHRN